MTAFIVLPLLVASIMIISSPRPVSAEGPLLGTVRCLLGSLLAGQCRPVQSPPAQPTSPTAPAPAPAEGGGSSPPAAPASPSGGNVQRQGQVIQAEPMPMPEENTAPIPTVPPVSEPAPFTTTMTDAEQLAFFNKYSTYAVAGAATQATAAPIERTDEGWRIYGVAWYWWASGTVVLVALTTSVIRKFLRKPSVLSEVS